MKIYIAYKFTGVSMEALNNTVRLIITKLREQGNDVFCNLERDDFYIKEKCTAKQIMDDCFSHLDQCEKLILFVAPNTGMGEGMLIELGYAIAKKKSTLLLLPEDFKSVSAKAVVDDIITYADMSDLTAKL